MNKIRTLKWGKFLLYISGGGLSAIFAFLAIVDPKRSVTWIGLGSAIIGIAGAIGALYPSPSGAVVQNAIEVTPSGTPTGATIASTDHPALQPPVVHSNQ